MILTKKHIARRTMLRGMGVTMALPFLEAMVPARTALAQAAPKRIRLAAIEIVHGAAGSTAYGAKKATVDRLHKGDTNQSDVGGVLQRNNIHIGVARPGDVGAWRRVAVAMLWSKISSISL